MLEVTVATLGTDDKETTDDEVDDDSQRGTPPNDGVADQVHLAVLPHPKVLNVSSVYQEPFNCNTHDTTTEPGPGLGTRVIGVAVSETCVGTPHDTLEFQELREERRLLVVDLFRVGID